MPEIFTCRVCESADNIEMILKNNKELWVMLEAVGLATVQNDELPQYICGDCLAALKQAFDFKAQYEATYEKLKGMSQCQKSVKEELPGNHFLLPEMAVKEELFSEEEYESECFNNSLMLDLPKASDAFKIEAADERSTIIEDSIDNSLGKRRDGCKITHANEKPEAEIEFIEIPHAHEAILAIKIGQNSGRKELGKGSQARKEKVNSITGDRILSQTDALEENGNAIVKRLYEEASLADPLFWNENQLQTMTSDCYHAENRREPSKGASCKDNRQAEGFRVGRVGTTKWLQPLLMGVQKDNILPTRKSNGEPFVVAKCKIEISDQCVECRKWFSDPRQFDLHHEQHSSCKAAKGKKHAKGSLSKQKLAQHQLMHSKAQMLQCDECEKSFRTVPLLRDHMMLHKDDDSFKCKICGKRLSSKNSLAKHQSAHQNSNSFKCELCGADFALKYHWQQHLMLHSNPDAFKCGHCGKRCLSSQHLKHHLMTYLNSVGKNYVETIFNAASLIEKNKSLSISDNLKCKDCNKVFLTKPDFWGHQLLHMNRKWFVCEYCAKSFTTEHAMKTHQQIRHPNFNEFKGKNCAKVFLTKQDLASHQRSHVGRNFFKCEHCERSFATGQWLKEHQFLHLNPDKFKCQRCEKRCLSSQHLKHHLMTYPKCMARI